jgi:hypothetical protein
MGSHIPDDSILHSHRREELKSYKVVWTNVRFIRQIIVHVVTYFWSGIKWLHISMHIPEHTVQWRAEKNEKVRVAEANGMKLLEDSAR